MKPPPQFIKFNTYGHLGKKPATIFLAGKNQLFKLALAIYISVAFKYSYGQYFCTANRLLSILFLKFSLKAKSRSRHKQEK